MATATPVRVREKMLLHDVDWQTYKRLLWVFAERPKVRLTYDRGVLEIMSPLFMHDHDSALLNRFVVVLTEELGLSLAEGGSTTLRRRRKQKGLEPDKCYWIASEPLVRGKRRLDLRIDPPPDLTLEVDVTSSSLDRMGIYAALGIPEVWRLDGPMLTFHALNPDGKYAAVTHSRSFPFVTPADLLRFLLLAATQDDNAVVRQFRDWVRGQSGTAAAP